MISTATHLQPSCSSSSSPQPRGFGITKPEKNLVTMRRKESEPLFKNAGFMSRRLNYLEALKRNHALAKKIEDLTKPECQIQAEMHDAEESIKELREKLEAKRLAIEQKRKDLKKMSGQARLSQRVEDETAKRHEAIKAAIASEALRLGKKSQKISEKRQEVDEAKRMRVLELMTFFFPIDQIQRRVVGEDDPKTQMQIERYKQVRMIADAMADVNAPKPVPTIGYWAAHSGGNIDSSLYQMAIKDNEFFSIADCRINDHCLYDNLRSYLVENRSTEASSDDLHANAAFTHCIQLLHNLSVILDYKLPFHFSLQEITKYRWTDNLFDTTVFKLNANIVHLCLAHGLSSEAIQFNRPYLNLLKLCEKFRTDLLVEPPLPITACTESPTLAKIMQEDFALLTWEDNKALDDWYMI